MNQHQFEKLLDKYLKGECSPQEEQLLHDFYESYQKENPHGMEVNPVIGHQIEDAIFNQIHYPEKIHQEPPLPKKKHFSRRIFQSLLVIIICLAIGTGSFLLYHYMPEETVALMQKSTKPGQRGTVTLMDGTKVHLNVDSRISFPQKFSKENREVTLVGEAFFEVTPNKKRPFIIHTENMTTTVLGTSFNIRSYAGENQHVTVATGKVKVQSTMVSDDTTLYLVPEQQAFFDGTLTKREGNLNHYFDWKNNIIRFQDTPLHQAVATLERWYGIDIEIQGNLLAGPCTISGQYQDETIFNVMKSFEYILGIQYHFDTDNKLIITGNQCKTSAKQPS